MGRKKSTETLKHEGVYQCKQTDKWRVFFNFQGKRYHIGPFDDFNQAKSVRNEAAESVNNIVQKAVSTLEAFKEKYSSNYREEHYINNTHVGRITSKVINKNNTSGVRGVSWSTSKQRWIATIGFKGKHYRLGGYTKLEDAKKARLDAEEQFYTQFLENLE